MSRKSFLLRIDQKLYEDIEAWAQQEMRSVNGQIEYLLKQSLLKRKSAPSAAPDYPGKKPQSGQTKED
jgi:hypothetical protein